MAEKFEARMRALLNEGARGRISAGLRRLALALAGLMEAQAVSLRSVAVGGSGGVVANRSRLVPRINIRAWPARISPRALFVAAGVAIAATAVALVIASVARSRRGPATEAVPVTQPVPATAQKEPVVIPIVTEPEPVTAGGPVAEPGRVGATHEPVAADGPLASREPVAEPDPSRGPTQS